MSVQAIFFFDNLTCLLNKKEKANVLHTYIDLGMNFSTALCLISKIGKYRSDEIIAFCIWLHSPSNRKRRQSLWKTRLKPNVFYKWESDAWNHPGQIQPNSSATLQKIKYKHKYCKTRWWAACKVFVGFFFVFLLPFNAWIRMSWVKRDALIALKALESGQVKYKVYWHSCLPLIV